MTTTTIAIGTTAAVISLLCWYLFLGGVAGGSGLLAAGAQVTGREALRRNARLGALGAVGVGALALVADLGRPVGGKTGTTSDYKDAWFVGFSPDLAVGVYIGFDKPRSLGDRATGGGLAAPIALDFLKQALKDKPPTPFRVPPGIKLIRVSAASGMRAGSGEGGGTILEAFKPGTAPPDAYVAAPAQSSSAPAAVPPDADRAAQAGGLY